MESEIICNLYCKCLVCWFFGAFAVSNFDLSICQLVGQMPMHWSIVALYFFVSGGNAGD